MKQIVPIILAAVMFGLFTGCQTQEEEIQHVQDRKQDMLMKQMQQQQEKAEKAERMGQ